MNVISLFLILAFSTPSAVPANATIPSNASVSTSQYMILRVTYTRNNQGFVPHLSLILSSNKATAAANGFSMAEKNQIRYSSPEGTVEILKNEVDVLNKAAELGWELLSVETAALSNGVTANNYILVKE